MYFLNGDRIYIEPDNKNETLEEQLNNCFSHLSKINSGKQVFKVNFFAETLSAKAYENLKFKIQSETQLRFSNSIITSLIAQPPLTCKIIAEAFYYDDSLWRCNFLTGENYSAAAFLQEGTEVVVGNVQVDVPGTFRENVLSAYASYRKVLKQAGFSIDSIIRQWNYLEDIVGFEGTQQRYQIFNNIRSEFYSGHFKNSGYPAATGIGMVRGGVFIEFIALKSVTAISQPLDNPCQVAAHGYSENVLVGSKSQLKSTPKFERARYLELGNQKMIFISGTASIVGERTVGENDPGEQTLVTIENIRRLYSADVLKTITAVTNKPRFGHVRVYVKNRNHFPVIKQTFDRYYGNLPVVYILADICRDNLLVEIEGKVTLD